MSLKATFDHLPGSGGKQMADMLFDLTASILGKVLDGTAARQRVLATNIANVETPGYTRKDLEFEGELREVMGRTITDPQQHNARIQQMGLEMSEDTTSTRRADGNNVDIEREMVSLAKNSLQYETTAQLLTMKMRGLKNAIHEGKR